MSYIDTPSPTTSVAQSAFTLYRFVTQIGDTGYIQDADKSLARPD